MVCECVSRSRSRSATWRLIFQEETAPLRQRCYLQSTCLRSWHAFQSTPSICANLPGESNFKEELSRRRVGWLYSQATHLGSPTSPSLFIIPPFNSQRISVEPSLLLFLFTFLLLVYFTVRMKRIYPSVTYYLFLTDANTVWVVTENLSIHDVPKKCLSEIAGTQNSWSSIQSCNCSL